MKQKYTITIADVEMNIITDESAENVEAIAGVLDRRIREIYLQSGSRCPKTEAALLCALDYCAERNMLQDQLTALEKQNNKPAVDEGAYIARIEALTKEKEAALVRAEDAEKKARSAEEKAAALESELEAARKAAAEAAAAPVKAPEVVPTEAPAEAPAEAKVEPVKDLADKAYAPAEITMKPLRSNVDSNQLSFDMDKKEAEAPAEAPVVDLTDEKTMENEKQKAQKRVRSMFDLINFDNV